MSLLALIRFLSEHQKAEKMAQPVAPVPKPAIPHSASKLRSFQRRLIVSVKSIPVLHWVLFFIAVLIVIIGLQAMYAELNPHGRYSQPGISWMGAILVATGVVILWFGRSLWLKK